MCEEIDTSNLKIKFGRHKGELWTRLPLGYLKYLINTNSRAKEIAYAELKRRGTVLDIDIDVSGHSMDRASIHCLNEWRKSKERNEGLYSWLARMAKEAIRNGKRITPTKIQYMDMIFCFTYGYLNPVLKTVYMSSSYSKLQGAGNEKKN